jgi:hypothetical protein
MAFRPLLAALSLRASLARTYLAKYYGLTLSAEAEYNEKGVDAPRLGSEGGVTGPEISALWEGSVEAVRRQREYGLV